jgi:tetratricopeptide (TPR) repeat protein
MLRGPFEALRSLLSGVLAHSMRLAPHLLALTLAARAEVARQSGCSAEAADDLTQALMAAGKAADPSVEARVLIALGQLDGAQGRTWDAQARLDKALALLRGRPSGLTCHALEELGRFHRAGGRPHEARTQLTASLALRRQLGDRRGEGTALHLLAQTYLESNRQQEAIDIYLEALQIAQEVGDRYAEAAIEGNMAMAYLACGRLDRAEELFQRAGEGVRRVGNRRDEGAVLANLGWLAHERGRLDEAESHYRRAIRLHQELDHRTGLGIASNNLALLLLERGRLDEAVTFGQQSLALLQQSGHHSAASAALALGLVKQAQGRLDEAQPLIQRALDARPSPRGEALDLAMLAALRAEQDDLEAAQELFERALAKETTAPERAAIELMTTHLDLAHARAAFREGDRARSETCLAGGVARLAAALVPTSPGHRGASLRLAAQELERDLQTTRQQLGRLD